jgi:hypothetical protein
VVAAREGRAPYVACKVMSVGTKVETSIVSKNRKVKRPAVFGGIYGYGLGFSAVRVVVALQLFGRNLQCQPVRGSGHPRGLPLVTRMAALQANMRGIQWHPRVQNHVKKRAPYLQSYQGQTRAALGVWCLACTR